jgi:hypothetical protein
MHIGASTTISRSIRFRVSAAKLHLDKSFMPPQVHIANKRTCVGSGQSIFERKEPCQRYSFTDFASAKRFIQSRDLVFVLLVLKRILRYERVGLVNMPTPRKIMDNDINPDPYMWRNGDQYHGWWQRLFKEETVVLG